jgi:hypothetical protein
MELTTMKVVWISAIKKAAMAQSSRERITFNSLTDVWRRSITKLTLMDMWLKFLMRERPNTAMANLRKGLVVHQELRELLHR